MRLVGTSDDGWVAIDLGDVARAIATLRGQPAEVRRHVERAAQDGRRSDGRARSGG